MQALSKMILGFLLCAFSGVFSGLFAESLVEGKDYVVLDNALNVLQPSVAEIFNVGCPHCASMQKVLPSLFAVPKQLLIVAWWSTCDEVLPEWLKWYLRERGALFLRKRAGVMHSVSMLMRFIPDILLSMMN